MATRYLLNCSNCSHENKVEARRAGQEINCPECETTIAIPRLGDLKKLPVDSSGESAKRSSDSTSRTSKVLFSIGLLLAVVAAAAGGGLYYYAGILQYPIDLNEEITEVNAELDEMQASQLWDTWHQFIAGSDLGEWQEDPKIRYNKQAEILRKFSYGIFGISGIGLLMMVSSAFMKKK